ncbi:MAG: hypothetical protein ACTJG2_04110 [Candidatus Saccharimonadales bacterium]
MNGKIKTLLLGALLCVGFGAALSPVASAAKCGGVDTALLSCAEDGEGDSIEQSGVWGILRVTLNVMAAGVGVAAVGGLIFAGVLYASAGDSQEQVKKAVGVITNVVIGLVLFAAMYIGVNYLVPGGILG